MHAAGVEHKGAAANPQRRWLERALAWGAAIVTVGTIGFVVALAIRAPEGIVWQGQATWLTLLTPLASVLVGATVVHLRGSHPVGWLFCGAGMCWALYHLGVAAGSYALNGYTMPAQDLLIWATAWAVVVEFSLAPVTVIYLFPTGRLPSRRWRPAFAVCVVAMTLGVAGNAFAPGSLEDIPRLNNPFGAPGATGTVMTVLAELSWPMVLASTLGGVVSLRQRARGASFAERQQIKWLLLAGVVLFGFVCFWGVTDLFGRSEIASSVSGLFLPVLPVAMGVAILKHSLYDIDILINRTLVYASLSAVLAVIYLAAVVLIGRLLGPITADSNIAIAGSTLAVAGLFRPLRGRIQGFIDQRFYRRKYDAAATLARFSTKLRHEVDLDALSAELLTAVGQTLQPASAHLWLRAIGPQR